MKVALYCALALCVFIVILGAFFLSMEGPIVARLTLGIPTILAGVAFGSMCISMFKDD